jgi:hypothetical protein
MPCETKDEGLREVTSETTLRTMYKIALLTKDQTTVQTTSQTIQEVIPQTGVSFLSLKPKVAGCKQIGRKAA